MAQTTMASILGWDIASRTFGDRTSVLKVLAFCFCLGFSLNVSATVYMTAEEFVAGSFDEQPSMNSLWLKAPEQQAAESLLGHPYRGLRLRYWEQGGKTAWILDEIGKEEPITIGVVVADNAIEKVRILTYRESRGGEVRHPFFLTQFEGLFLQPNQRLNERIDGISGATLSVWAVTNISRFALFLHQQVLAGQPS